MFSFLPFFLLSDFQVLNWVSNILVYVISFATVQNWYVTIVKNNGSCLGLSSATN